MDPLALMSYALAAAGGRVDRFETSRLVAAGLTLLQRSAPLVRSLGTRRAALLLPPGPAWIVALSASDGRGALLLDPAQPDVAEALHQGRAGAVFTTADMVGRLPPGIPHVLLDDAPFRARVVTADRDGVVDLGSHFPLDLIGDIEGPGAAEECVADVAGPSWSHQQLKAAAREAMARFPFTPVDRVCTTVPWSVSPESADALVLGCLAPLMAGAHVYPVPGTEAGDTDAGLLVRTLERTLESCEATMLVTDATMLARLVSHAECNGAPVMPLKMVLSTSPCSAELRRRAAACRLPLAGS